MKVQYSRFGSGAGLFRLAAFGCAAAALAALSLFPLPAAAETGAQVSPAVVYGKLLSGIESELLGVAEAMPAEKYGFAPTGGNFQGVRTFGEQLTHVAGANYHYFSSFGITPGPGAKTLDSLKSKEEIVKALKESFAFAHRAIDTMTAQNAFADLGKNNATRAGTAAFIMAHCNDHYGQLVEYLRMNGIVPPASRK